MGENPLRIGIVGSRKYENRKKIKDFIFKLKMLLEISQKN